MLVILWLKLKLLKKKIDAKDKIKASELLAKRYYLFNDREIRLKEKKLELETKKALGETKDNNITIKVVRASEQNGRS